MVVYLAYSADLLDMTPIRLRITDEGVTLPNLAGDKVLVALRWRDLGAFHDHLTARLVNAR